MAAEQPETQTLTAMDARQQWSKLLDKVSRHEARVIVEQEGVPVAAIISAQDLERFQWLEAERQRDLATLRASQEGFKDASPDEIEREVAKALAEVRAERVASQGSEGKAR